MRCVRLFVPAAAALGLVGAWVLGQVPPPPPAVAPPPPAPTPLAPAPVAPPAARPTALIVPPSAVPNTPAATVNGANVMEVSVQRALKNIKPEQRDAMRPEVLNF